MAMTDVIERIDAEINMLVEAKAFLSGRAEASVGPRGVPMPQRRFPRLRGEAAAQPGSPQSDRKRRKRRRVERPKGRGPRPEAGVLSYPASSSSRAERTRPDRFRLFPLRPERR